MRINARLDENHSRKLQYLKHATGANVSEVIKRAIDVFYERVRTEGGDAQKILTRSGFIGCAEGPGNLSERYKEELIRGLTAKHDHR